MEWNRCFSARSFSVAALVVVLSALCCTTASAADTDRAGVGELIAGMGENKTPLVLQSHNLSVTINDQIAVTQIEQTFSNPTDKRLSAVFSCVLPPDATVVRFARKTDKAVIEAQLSSYTQTEQREKVIPVAGRRSLLDTSEFQAVVDGIAPGGEVTLVCAWLQTLTASGDSVEYACALPAGDAEVSADAEVRSSVPMTGLNSPSHKRTGVVDDGIARLSIDDAGGSAEFALTWQITEDAAPMWASAYLPEGEEGYFIAGISAEAFLPPNAPEPEQQAEPANLLFMIDTSASMNGDKLEAAKQVMRAILDSRNEGDRFNILACDVAGKLLFPEFFDNLPAFRDLALEQFKPVVTLGGSDLGNSCKTAAEELAKACKEHPLPRTDIIYIGDGQATYGNTKTTEIIKMAAEAFAPLKPTVSAVGIGSGCDREFLDCFAGAFGGFSYYYPNNPADAIAARMAARSVRPSIKIPILMTLGFELHNIYPSTLPYVAAGEQVLIVGRCTGSGELRLAAGNIVRSVKVADSGNALIAKEWARRRITALSAEAAAGSVDAARQMASLSKETSIDSPCTEFQLPNGHGSSGVSLGPQFAPDQWEQEPESDSPVKYWSTFVRYIPEESRSNRRNRPLSIDDPLTLDEVLGQSFVNAPADAIALPEDNKSYYSPQQDTFDHWQWGPGEPMNLTYTPSSNNRYYDSVQQASEFYRNGMLYPLSVDPPRWADYTQNNDLTPEVVTLLKDCLYTGSFEIVVKGCSFDDGGKERNPGTGRFTKVGEKFEALFTYAERRSHHQSDGSLCYTYHDSGYISAREATQYDFYRDVVNDIPLLKPLEFLLYRAREVSAEDADGDRTTVTIQGDNSKKVLTLDTKRKVILEEKQFYLAHPENELRLQRRVVVDQVKEVNGIFFPMRARFYGADERLRGEFVFEDVKLGDFETDASFAPQAEAMVIQYPLPDAQTARQKAEEENTDAALLALALSLEQSKKYEDAAAAAEKLYIRRPQDYTLRLYLGWLQTAAGNQDAFLQAVTEAEKLLPEVDPETENRPGRSPHTRFFSEVGRLADSLHLKQDQQLIVKKKILASSIDDANTCITATASLARLYINSNHHAEAAAVWEETLKRFPESGRAWREAGSFFYNYLTKMDRAEEALVKAQELGENVDQYLANLYMRTNQQEKALPYFERCVEDQVYQTSTYLRCLAIVKGNEAACAEAERLLKDAAEAADKENKNRRLGKSIYAPGGQSSDYKRKRILSEYCRFLTLYYPDEEKLTAVCKKMVKENHDLSTVLQACRNENVTYDPIPEILERFKTEFTDYADYRQRLNELNSVSYYMKDELEAILPAYENPAVEIPDANRAEVFNTLAALYSQIESPEAERFYRRVLELDLKSTDYYKRQASEGLMRVLLKKGEVEAATEILVQALSKNSNEESQSVYQMTQLFQGITEAASTEKLLNAQRQLEENLPDYKLYIHIMTAWALSRLNEPQQSCRIMRDILADLDDALNADAQPENPDREWFCVIGRRLIELAGSYNQVAEELDPWIMANSQGDAFDGRWTELRVKLLADRGRLDELSALLQELSQTEAGRARWRRYLAATSAARGDYASARRIYRDILDDDPEDLGVLAELSRIAYAEGNVQESQELWHQWLENAPTERDYLQRVYERLRSNRSPYQVADVLELLMTTDQNTSYYAHQLADAYRQMGRSADAALAYIKGTRPDPQSGSSGGRDQADYLIRNYLQEDAAIAEFDAEMKAFLAAVDDPEWKGELLAMMAKLHIKRGSKPQAVDWATKALKTAEIDADSAADALAVFDQAILENERPQRLQEIARATGGEVSPALQLRLIGQLFNAGKTEEAEQSLNKLQEAHSSRQIADLLPLLAEQIAADNRSRALALLDQAAGEASGLKAAAVLLKKAEILAAADDVPPEDVLDAFRAARDKAPVQYNTNYGQQVVIDGRQLEKKFVVEKMIEYARKANLQNDLFAMYKEVVALDRNGASNHINAFSQYLREKKIENGEKMLVELANSAQEGYARTQAISVVGNFIANNDQPDDAIEYLFDELMKERDAEADRYRYNILNAVCTIAQNKQNAIDQEKFKKLLLEYIDEFLADENCNSEEWRNSWSFGYAVKRLNLIDTLNQKFRALPKNKPELTKQYINIGGLYERTEEYADAIEFYKMALPSLKSHELSNTLGQIVSLCERAGKFEEGLEHLDQMPSNRRDDRMRMKFLGSLGRMDEARETAQQASQKAGTASSSHSYLARTALEAGLFDFALEETLLSIQLAATENNGVHQLRDCYKTLSSILLKQGKTEQAIRGMLVGINAIPSNYQNDLAYDFERNLREAPNPDVLLETYGSIVKETGLDSAAVRTRLAYYYQRKNQNQQATQQIDKALELDHTNRALWQMYLRQAEQAGTEEQIRRAQAGYLIYVPNDGGRYSMLINAARGNDDEVLRIVTTPLDAEPNSSDGFRHTADYFGYARQFEQAIPFYRKAIEVDPDNPEPYYTLARAYQNQGQKETAIELYEKMLQRTWPDRYGNSVQQRVTQYLEALKQ